MVNFYKKIGKTTAIITSLLAVTTAQAQNSIYAWGDGSNGKLGTGISSQETSPVQTGTATNWLQVSAGIYNSLALKSDGTLWAWGENWQGQSGTGNNPRHQFSPVQVGTDTNWSQVSAGFRHSLAIKSDGTLWAWGGGDFGKLGTGSTSSQYTPLQIGTATNWLQVSAGEDHSLAIKSDGTLWGWGRNQEGQLGTGTTTDQLSPVQVGIATNWLKISAGWYHSIALKSDGTLWAWGWNYYWQLGTGTNTDHLSPMQIGTATNWVEIGAGTSHSLAIKSNGTLWAWGRNLDGQLGIGNTTDQRSPVQVGTATNWVKTSAGYNNSLALVAASAGIHKNEIKNFAVYPNPANSILNIDSNIQENIKITIVDITGKTLTEQILKEGNNTINISSFANGVYFIKTEKGGSVKFIKD